MTKTIFFKGGAQVGDGNFKVTQLGHISAKASIGDDVLKKAVEDLAAGYVERPEPEKTRDFDTVNRLLRIIPPRYSKCKFLNFRASEDDKVALNGLVHACRSGNIWAYLYGANGCGKTHLAFSAVREAVKVWCDNFIFAPSVDIISKIKEAIGDNNTDEAIKSFLNVELLVIDDIGKESQTEWVNELVFRIVNHRYNYLKSTIFTGNLDPQRLATECGGAIASRVCSGLCVEVHGEDYRLKN